jgi:tetratricopeptide (TPR) repeat protein
VTGAHPSLEDFRAFFRSKSGPGKSARNTKILRHLLADCQDCRERLSEMGLEGSRLARLVLLPGGESVDELNASSGANGYDYGNAFLKVDRAVSALLTSEPPSDVRPEDLWAELSVLPVSEQISRVRSDRRFAVSGLVKDLTDRSHSMRYRDPEETLHLADLARLAADACFVEGADQELRLADLRARAWGQYGNALRLNARLREAEQALMNADRNRLAGTGDPMLRAALLERWTSLRTSQGLYDSAIEMAEEVGQVYRELGETHLLASSMVQKAIASLYAGESESAIRTLNRAIPLIDHEDDPNLLLAACHNLIHAYVMLDRPEQALLLYSEIRTLYREFTDPLILLRAAWQEGELLRDLGHLRAAETILLNTRKGFLEKNQAYEAALISLDLAAIYVKLGLAEELKQTVAVAVPVFRALQVDREALAALLQLQQIADQEHRALELIRFLNARVKPLPKQPAAR